MISQRCVNCSMRVGWIVLGINIALFVLKFSFAFLSYSRSLLTDSFQSLANILVTIVVLASLRMAARRPDERFPYGYGKVEFLASGIVNVLLMFGAIVFVFLSLLEMAMVGPEKPPKLIAVVAAAISIVGNLVAYGYGRCAGEKLGSSAILANAEVSRADVGTSIAVVVAVVGANLGFSRLDHIAAIVICLLIIKVTWDGMAKAVKGLMDASLHLEEEHIKNLIEQFESVSSVGDVKARFVGRNLWADVSVFVPADWALARGLETARKIKGLVCSKMKNVLEVTVQLVPVNGSDDLDRPKAIEGQK